jgi:hypothetical protein
MRTLVLNDRSWFANTNRKGDGCICERAFAMVVTEGCDRSVRSAMGMFGGEHGEHKRGRQAGG